MDKTTSLILNAKRLQQANKLEPAKAIYSQVLKHNPNNADVLHLMGILHHQLKDYDTAIRYFQKVMGLTPNVPQLYHNLGLSYKEQGKLEEAIACYRKAITLRPGYSEAFEKLGNVFSQLGETRLAIDHFQRALQLNAKNMDAWINCANAFAKLELYPEAEECYQRALQLDPNSALTLFNLGDTYKDQKKYSAAIPVLKKVLKINPSFSKAFASLATINDTLCDWQDYDDRERKLFEIVKQHNVARQFPAVSMLTSLAKNWDPQEQLKMARHYAQNFSQQAAFIKKNLLFQFDTSPKNRLKIGYISSDLQDHPVAYLTNNLFSLHDRNHFEIFVFSLCPPNQSIYYQHIANTCDHFIDLSQVDDSSAARKIYENKIDILIDLNGYTKNSRGRILAIKPAPIQAHYLGYLGTTGASYIDYIIADETAVPPEIAAHGYSEKMIYLPQYQIFDNKQVIAEKPLKRADYGLPDNAFVYCCFNQTYKINPSIFSLWMDILKQTANSVLWLFANAEIAENNLRQEAEKRGVDSKRLVFVKHEERSIYLARYRLADLFLDTPAYNANTTGSDALWAGLPMITTPGTTFAGRGATSSLTALGLPELVLPNLDCYRNLAIEFYNNPEKLKQIKAKLEKNRLTQPLFDTPRFVRNLEKAYLKMWEHYAAGQSPQQIKIEDV